MAENPHHQTPESDTDADVNVAPESTPPPPAHPDPPLAPPEKQHERPPEKDLWSGRTSWRHYLGSMIVGLLIVIVLLYATGKWGPAGSVSWMLWLAFIAAIVYAGRVGYLIFRTRYRLTSERLFIERGILSQTIDQTELIRVDDVRVHKSILDRVFGLATIEIMSTDSTHASVRIDGVADGDRVGELVRAHMRTARRSTLFMESL